MPRIRSWVAKNWHAAISLRGITLPEHANWELLPDLFAWIEDKLQPNGEGISQGTAMIQFAAIAAAREEPMTMQTPEQGITAARSPSMGADYGGPSPARGDSTDSRCSGTEQERPAQGSPSPRITTRTTP